MIPRYEVGFDGELCAYYSTFRCAANAVPEGGYIYDRLAHVGKPQLWLAVGGDLIVQSVRLLDG